MSVREYNLRVASRYTDDEKRRMVADYLKKRKKGTTLTSYASICGISKYTFRDWFRDPRYNPEWEVLHPDIIGEPPLSVDSENAIHVYENIYAPKGISLHEYAGITSIPYYTLRSWYRKYHNAE